MNELFRALPTYIPAGTSHCNFRLSLSRDVDCISTWEFSGVGPRQEHFESHQNLLGLCRTVQHDYRKSNIWEHISATLLMVGFGIVFVLGLLLRVLWFPIGRLRRLLTR